MSQHFSPGVERDKGSWLPGAWSEEADVVVVGAGGAGVAAAWEAASAGASVVLLEKTHTGGGSSVMAGASLAGGTFAMAGTPLQQSRGITDSPAQFYEDLIKWAGAWAIPDILRAHAEHSREAYTWLTGLGAQITRIQWQGGHCVPRSHMIDSLGVFRLILKDAIARGARLLPETPGERLIVDANRRVLGVKARNKGNVVRVKASKAVVIATGGFCHNREMLMNYYGPGLENCVIAAPRTHTGDGIRMALAAGADTMKMAIAGKPGGPKHPGTRRAVTAVRFGAVMVNAAGERFGDESIEFHEFPVLFQKKQPRGLGWQVYDENIANAFKDEPQQKIAITADSLEELALKINVSPSNLRDTIEKYNVDIDQYGYDKVFGRKALRANPARGELLKIACPPFYAIESYPSLTLTQGGIRINGQSQVIDVFGEIMPGLYAAGETAPSISFGGCMLGGAYIFGRIAGKNAAAESPWC